MRTVKRLSALAGLSVIGLLIANPLAAGEGDALLKDGLLRVDHYVRVRSTVPAIASQTTQIYVREVVKPSLALRETTAPNQVVLFVHGAGTPAEVSFDVPYQNYSWMAWLAQAGFDVFAMDTTGYGRSSRPNAMNDPCNLTEKQQMTFVPGLLSAPCQPAYAQQMTTIASDWNDIGAVVDHLLALRHVAKVSLVAWSLGGPRAGGFAAQHPDKVNRLVLLAPAYNRAGANDPPEQVPAKGAAFNTQSHGEFTANWDRQVGCPAQYDPQASEAVWSAMLESDPVGATWGTGVRRAPQVTTWGWASAAVTKMSVPTLAVSGQHDKQVPQERVREFYADLGSKEKVFVDLACSSHNAMWEKNHLLLFGASLEWLTKGTVSGMPQGTLRLGY
jgi:pimeloyl-ACP methyl ester carboxylesterase